MTGGQVKADSGEGVWVWVRCVGVLFQDRGHSD